MSSGATKSAAREKNSWRESLRDVAVVDDAEAILSSFEGRHLCSKGEEQVWRPRHPKEGSPHKRWVKVF